MPMRAKPEDDSQIKQEMEQMKYEPLLKVEKSLILWSLILGAVLMVILVWVSFAFFPGS
jgi:cell division protein FtsL